MTPHRIGLALLRLLHVPPEPEIIAGETEVQIFRAAPRYLTWKLVKWGLGQLILLSGLVVITLQSQISSPYSAWGLVIFALLWTGWVLQLVVTYLILRLDYEQRWYILTDRSLRIREGVWRVTEKTMSFANIQQLTVTQGPLQKLLGISDLVVRSAGGGGSPGGETGSTFVSAKNPHIAFFRGIAEAEAIRAQIRGRIREFKDTGLGDPDEVHRAQHRGGLTSPLTAETGPTALAGAVRELGREARALRRLLETGGPALEE